ncbi:unnamed protein product, partial [Discosporangium mesarthrocarpum]
KGKFVFPGGGYYEGGYKVVDGQRVRHGTGRHVNGEEVYVGTWENDAMSGKGWFMKFVSRASYIGDFKGNKFQGNGVYTWADGSKYEGEWKDNK